MSSQVFEYIKECVNLSKLKENETTWSKIDKLFLNLTTSLNNKDDSEMFIKSCNELLCRSIISDRSKLSGTSLVLLKKISVILKDDLKLHCILPNVLKVCGRSNKVVYSRGHDTIEHLSKNVDLSPYYKILYEHYNSINKNIRLGVIKGITICDDKSKFIKIIEKAKTDQFIEIRNLIKSCSINHTQKFEPRPILKKELSPQKQIINHIQPKHSPYKKSIKLESESNLVCEKITELEKQVKLITNNKPKIDKPKVKVISKKQQLSVKKEVKDLSDDLTPRKLDKYLSKYRNIYGNILEENKKDEINFYDTMKNKPNKEEKCNIDEDNEFVDEMRIKNINDCVNEVQKNIVHSQIEIEKTNEYALEINNDINTNVENLISFENKELMDSIEKDITNSILSNDLNLKSKDEIDINISKDLSNLSIAEESIHFNYTIMNSDKINNDECSLKKINSSISEKQIKLIEEEDLLEVVKDYEKSKTEPISFEKFEKSLNINNQDECKEIDKNNKTINVFNEKFNEENVCNISKNIEENNNIVNPVHLENKEKLKTNSSENNNNFEIKIVDKKEEIINKALQINVCTSKSTPSISNKSLQENSKNRFTAFLYSDKDECVIYDINSDSPKFKNLYKESSDMHSSLNLKQSELNSSFLYSKEENKVDNIIGDYTKIDSCIYADKSTFKNNNN